MTRTVTLSISAPSLGSAREIEGAWLNLIEPAPQALSLFEIEPDTLWRIDAYYTPAPQINELHQALQSALSRKLPPLEIREVPNSNWTKISQSGLSPVHAGRFTIHGSHDRHRVAFGPNAIEIDAAEAFGTAHHPTTFGCLEAITRLTRIKTFKTVLDLGTGTGVLAIAAARTAPCANILASDNDREAVQVAQRNSRQNRTRHQIHTITANGLTHPRLRNRAAFNLVIANILAGPLIKLAPAISKATSRKGNIILSGLLADQAPEVVAAYRMCGFALDRNNRIANWSTLTMSKRTSV